MATKEDYEIGQLPKEDRFFTNSEIRVMTGYSSCNLTRLCKKLRIYPERVLVNSRYVKQYSYSQMRRLMDYKLDHEKKETAPKYDESHLSTEELFKLHPLVRDPEFLKLEYFPNPTPCCFAEIDSWVV